MFNVKSRCQKTFHIVTSLSISKHQKDEFDSFPQNLTHVSTGLATLMILMMVGDDDDNHQNDDVDGSNVDDEGLHLN